MPDVQSSITDLLRVGDLFDQVDAAGADWNAEANEDTALDLVIAAAQQRVQLSIQRTLAEISRIVGIPEQKGFPSRHQTLWTSARVIIETLENGKDISTHEEGQLLLLLARLVVKMRINGSRPKPSFFDRALNLLKPNQLRFQQDEKETIKKAVTYLEGESYRL